MQLKKDDMLGRIVTVKVDRPMGSWHPEHTDLYYPVNYGYIEGIIAADGEEQDAYLLGVNEPVEEYTGKIIAVVHRYDDVEEKWVVVPEECKFTEDEIREKIHFQEKFFHSEIRMKGQRGMSYTYRRASLEDINVLSKTRIQVLRAANDLSEDVDMSFVEQQSREYYAESLPKGMHIAYLVYDGERFIGAGGASIFRVMPTFHNPTGMKAYIMNMYTDPYYRRQGIAIHVLDLLVKEIKEKGIDHISLEATAAGRPLYEKYGFVRMDDEMEIAKGENND